MKLQLLTAIAALALSVITASGAAQTTPTAAAPAAAPAPPTSSTIHFVDRWLPNTVSRDRKPTSPVDMIMLHFSSDLIAHPDDPFNVDRVLQVYRDAKVSAHYLIGRDGTVYRLVPESRVAYHAGKGSLPWLPGRKNNLNEYSIGIEMLNVGSARDMAMFMKPEPYQAYATKHPNWIGYTPAQYTALKELIAEIRSRHPLIKFDRYHIIGHEEWSPTRRSDPGETFDYTKIGLPKTR